MLAAFPPPACSLGLCYRLGGDNLSELSANYQPPGDKTCTDNSPQGSLRVYPRTNSVGVCLCDEEVEHHDPRDDRDDGGGDRGLRQLRGQVRLDSPPPARGELDGNGVSGRGREQHASGESEGIGSALAAAL